MNEKMNMNEGKGRQKIPLNEKYAKLPKKNYVTNKIDVFYMDEF